MAVLLDATIVRMVLAWLSERPPVDVANEPLFQADVQRLRADTKKAVSAEQFRGAIKNIGDQVAYLDAPDFAKFWEVDAKRSDEAVQAIGKVSG